MKLNEEKLMSQLQFVRANDLKTDSVGYNKGDYNKVMSLEEKLGEYEQIVLEQRERLIDVENRKLELET